MKASTEFNFVLRLESLTEVKEMYSQLTKIPDSKRSTETIELIEALFNILENEEYLKGRID